MCTWPSPCRSCCSENGSTCRDLTDRGSACDETPAPAAFADDAVVAASPRRVLESHQVQLDGLGEREGELRDTPEEEDTTGDRREGLRRMRDERLKPESNIEQVEDRAWRMREQAGGYQSEVAEIRSWVAHLEAGTARWLDDLE